MPPLLGDLALTLGCGLMGALAHSMMLPSSASTCLFPPATAAAAAPSKLPCIPAFTRALLTSNAGPACPVGLVPVPPTPGPSLGRLAPGHCQALVSPPTSRQPAPRARANRSPIASQSLPDNSSGFVHFSSACVSACARRCRVDRNPNPPRGRPGGVTGGRAVPASHSGTARYMLGCQK
jgi:hypothetical protein